MDFLVRLLILFQVVLMRIKQKGYLTVEEKVRVLHHVFECGLQFQKWYTQELLPLEDQGVRRLGHSPVGTQDQLGPKGRVGLLRDGIRSQVEGTTILINIFEKLLEDRMNSCLPLHFCQYP